MKLVIQILLFSIIAAYSVGAEEQEKFDEIVTAIRQADQLIEEGKDRQAIAQYQLAQKQLLQFQESNPDWDKQVVAFRLNYLSEKLEAWKSGKNDTSSSTAIESQEALQNRATYLERANSQYQYQLKQLHAENSRLNTKLREALALRPAAQEPSAIAETQSQLATALKELEIASNKVVALDKELAEYPEPEEAKQNAQLLEEMRKNLNQVVAEAEELRTINETLRKGAATRRIPASQNSTETLHREIVSAQAAQQLAEREADGLRRENENLNTRLASLEAKFEASNTAQGEPANPRLSMTDSARMALAHGDSEKAVSLLADALKEDPKDVEILHLLGRAFMLQKNPTEAEISLKKVLELTPQSGVTHFELARLYYSRDEANPGLARWHYHKALNLGFPRNSEFEKNIRWEEPGE